MSSSMWNYFEKVDLGGACKLCNIVVKTFGNTTNLKRHLKRKHSGIYTSIPKYTKSNTTAVEDDEYDALYVQSVPGTQITLDTSVFSQSRPLSQCSLHSESDSMISKTSDSVSVISNLTSSSRTSTSSKLIQPTIYESISEMRSYETGGAKSVSITNALVYMLVKDNIPVSSVEKDGFKCFMKKVLPNYEVPSRNTLTKLISSKYDVLSVKIKDKLSLVESITLTTDVWSDTINTKSYLGMTVHFLGLCKLKLESVTLGVLELDERHSSQNIVGWLNDTLKTWGIDKRQVFLVVTNNGSNIKNAVYECFGKDKHLPCFAHTLNFVVQNALDNTENISIIIEKVKKIVTFYKQSVSASDELHKVCNFKLKQSVPRQWNSVYFMLDRFINCSDFVASTIVKFPKGPPMLTGFELFAAKEIMNILKPFEAATKLLCGQNYKTVSKVIPLVHCLVKKIEPVEVNSVIASGLKSNLVQNLNTRFGRIEYIEILSIATILDPRFKTLHLNAPIASSRAINTIKEKILELRTECSEPISNSENDPDNLWSVHKKLVSKKAINEPSMNINEMPSDLKHYLNQPTLALDDNILNFWDTHGPIYPNLKKIVDPYLTMVATSVPSERLFSKAGQFMIDSRNRLSSDNLNKLLFLRSLSESDWHLE